MKTADLSNVKQTLVEKMADFLDSEFLLLEEIMQEIKDPLSREESELHIRMAEAAFEEYKKSMKPVTQ